LKVSKVEIVSIRRPWEARVSGEKKVGREGS
jgi:hypothetical protein